MAPRKGTADKENQQSDASKTRSTRAVWNATCDAILLEKLEQEKADGRMTSNSSFHDDAWKAAEKALAGTELHSGGAKKTADSCKYRYAILKKSHGQVKTLRDSSGFGWDDEKQLVTAEEAVWVAFLERRPTAFAKWRDTAFPLYGTMHNLQVNGTVATGANAFRPGREDTPPSDSSEGSDDPPQAVIDPFLFDDQSQSSDPASQTDNESKQRPASRAPPATPLGPAIINGRKRYADENLDSVSTKRSRKPITAAAGIVDMASSVRELATAFSNSGGPSSPARRSAAIELIEEDDELSDNEQLEIFQVIRKDVSVADTILAIKNKGKRTRYIQRELGNHM